jgi:hypothetical protein
MSECRRARYAVARSYWDEHNHTSARRTSGSQLKRLGVTLDEVTKLRPAFDPRMHGYKKLSDFRAQRAYGYSRSNHRRRWALEGLCFTSTPE